MNAIDILVDLAGRTREAAARIEASPTRLNAHAPGQDNSIAWLLWHAARQMDEQVCDLSGGESVWVEQGFDRRFDLGLRANDMGYGHTSQEARRIRTDNLELLREHLSAVIDAQIAYLKSLSEKDLDDVVDDNWEPVVTRGARLVSVNEDALQHVGQALYLAGMDDVVFSN